MRARSVAGAVIGFLTAGVGVGLGELAAVFVRPEASPVIAVGNRIITLTPGDIERSTVESVGSNDKPFLIAGILIVLALFGIMIGQAAMRRLRNGFIGVAIFGAVGVYCALTADASRTTDVIPSLVAAAGAALTMWALVSAAGGDERQAGLDAPLEGTDRRRVLQGGAATAALAALAGFGGRAAQAARFSVAPARAKITLPAPSSAAPPLPTGTDLGKSGLPWATSSAAFYRVDRALTTPQVDPKGWRLRIHGMVDKPMTLSYDDVLARPLIERWITLCCVSNEVGGDLVGNALFLGARLADVLREAGIHADANQLLMTGAEGTTIGAPTKVVMDGRDAMLVVGMNKEPLPIAHGFPVRVVVPGLYGYVSACKWVMDIEATTFQKHLAYWPQNGWDQQTDIQIASRIDRPHSGSTVPAGQTVAIAGVAWDQHVGISSVEVQVDDGQWTRARLAPVPSTDTWRQWVLPWTPTSTGSHRLRVRATDAYGDPQVSEVAPPGPGGATGLHTITVHVKG